MTDFVPLTLKIFKVIDTHPHTHTTQHGANPSLIDHEGYNALFYAKSAGSIACAELLRVGGNEGPTLPRRKPPNTSVTGA